MSVHTQNLLFLPVIQSLMLVNHLPKDPRKFYPIQEGVENMRSEIEPSIYFHINQGGQSDHNNLRCSYNNETKYDHFIPKLHIDHRTYFNALCQTKGFK